MYSNIFWALLFIISKHHAAGGMLDPVVKAVQETYTTGREEELEIYSEVRNDFKGLICDKYNPYRSIDGTCNNVKDPGLGAAYTTYKRFWSNSYCDGIEKLPCSSSNDCLLSARKISLILFSNKKKLDCDMTSIGIGFGQTMIHDLARAYSGANVVCCENGKYTSNQETHPKCAAIDVCPDDPVFGPADRQCLNFVRSDTDNCKPVKPINAVTAWLDGSPIYGSNEATSTSLRTMMGGKLQSQEKYNKEWLPQSLDPMETCFNLTSPEESCYRAGDERVNQNAFLTLTQTVFMRLHNKLACEICGHKMCPWEDEKCFQEVRRIVIAILQRIFYEEYLVAILGKKFMYENKLITKESCRDEDGYVDHYDCDCDPSISVEFSSAAARGQHSAIPGILKLYFESEDSYKNKKRCDNDYFDVGGSIDLNRWMNRPSVIEKNDNSIGLSHCLHVQHQEAVDKNYVDQIRHLLFSGNFPVGTDLLSLDIQRARDHGVTGYCKAALECGTLTKCDCFDDLKKYIPKKSVAKLKEIYNGQVCDVELMVGGMLERLEPGTRVGPTFQCIIGKQLWYTKCADRYWYENKDQPYPFTPEQLCNIRQYPMSSILCEFGDGVDKIQEHAFKKISKKNPLKNCCDLPTLDYSLFQTWKNK